MDDSNFSRPRRVRPRRSFPPPPQGPGPTLQPDELRLRAGVCGREARIAVSSYTADLLRRLAAEYERRADAIERGEPPPFSSVLPNPTRRRYPAHAAAPQDDDER